MTTTQPTSTEGKTTVNETIQANAQGVQQVARMLQAADALEQLHDGNVTDGLDTMSKIAFSDDVFGRIEILRVMDHMLEANVTTPQERLDSYRAKVMLDLREGLARVAEESASDPSIAGGGPTSCPGPWKD